MPSKRDLLRQANRPTNKKEEKTTPIEKTSGNLVDELIESVKEVEAETPKEATVSGVSSEKDSKIVDKPAEKKENAAPALSLDIPKGPEKRTSIIIQDVNINYMNYIVAILKTNRQNYLSALIHREMQGDSSSEGTTIPDFSRPVKKKKLPTTNVSQQGIIIYTYAWEYAQQKADLLRETVSVYIDDLLTVEREKFMKEHSQN